MTALTAAWSRKAGPPLELDWLQNGDVIEEIPSWFIDLFVKTRDVGAVKPGETDNCTMTTVEDNWCLYRLAQLARPSKSLEIGIMRGSSSITIGKAYVDAGIDCVQTGLDIDPAATTAAASHFRKYALHSKYSPVVADSREWIRASNDRWQFVFLDGDHVYDTVALEFAEAFNRTDPGGIIVLHDTGSVKWGTNEDPGLLFFDVLDEEVGTSGEMTWLDSTSCNTDMKLRTSLGHHKSLPIITTGIAVGYGGLGIVRKTDSSRTLDAARLISKRPPRRGIFVDPLPPPTPIRRAARRIAKTLGI
ncbi:MAG TPA: class I SAM-dependent methyltransferase [Gemmatimonadaceae bacterium]|nr:class I SAM-dependent methyltransferase [Gemmatimonadaceae bacterium]